MVYRHDRRYFGRLSPFAELGRLAGDLFLVSGDARGLRGQLLLDLLDLRADRRQGIGQRRELRLLGVGLLAYTLQSTSLVGQLITLLVNLLEEHHQTFLQGCQSGAHRRRFTRRRQLARFLWWYGDRFSDDAMRAWWVLA